MAISRQICREMASRRYCAHWRIAITGNVYSPWDVTTVVNELVAGTPVTSVIACLICTPYIIKLSDAKRDTSAIGSARCSVGSSFYLFLYQLLPGWTKLTEFTLIYCQNMSR